MYCVAPGQPAEWEGWGGGMGVTVVMLTLHGVALAGHHNERVYLRVCA